MYTNRKKGRGAGWQGNFVEELLVHNWKGRKTSRRISHGRGEEEKTFLPRTNTEKHGKSRDTEKKKKRHFCHGMPRKNTEAAEELATDEHGKTRK